MIASAMTDGTQTPFPLTPSPSLADEQANEAAMVFGLLADPTRLRIVDLLVRGDTDVAGLAEAAGCSATAASQHLARLRLAGLVTGSREGRRVIYRLRDPRLGHVLAAIFPAARSAQPFDVAGAAGDVDQN